MTVTFDIPDQLAQSVAENAQKMSREAFALEALKRGLWTEAQLGEFLGFSWHEREQFLKDHGVELDYTWEDLQHDREALDRLFPQ